MAKWLGFLVVAAVWVGPAEAQAGDSPSVRGTHPELTGAIAEAAEQSPTFKDLVAAIGSAGGLVYVHHGTCGRNVRACLLLNITQAGRHRLLKKSCEHECLRSSGETLVVDHAAAQAACSGRVYHLTSLA